MVRLIWAALLLLPAFATAAGAPICELIDTKTSICIGSECVDVITAQARIECTAEELAHEHDGTPPPDPDPCEWDPTIPADDPLCVEPPPPVDECEWDPTIPADDPDCVEPPTEPPQTGATCQEASHLVDDFVCPALPVTSSTVNVATTSALQAALNQPGTIVNVAAGAYGSVTVNANDIDLRMDIGTTINGTLNVAPRTERFRWSGGNADWNGMETPKWRSVSDISLNDVNIHGSLSFHVEGGVGGNHRISLVDFTLRHSIGEFGLFFFQSQPHSDLFMSNVRLEQWDGSGSHSTARLQTIERTIILDSAFSMDSGNIESTGFRLSAEMNHGYMANSLVAYRQHFTYVGDGGCCFAYAHQDWTFVNISRYVMKWDARFANPDMDLDNTGTVSGSRMYATRTEITGQQMDLSPMTAGPDNPDGTPSNEPIILWNGVFPDVSGYGAQR